MTRTLPKVFAIVLNYNGRQTILESLGSIFASDYGNLEVVVVDNGSSDGSLELARTKYPRAHYIVSSNNLGFAGGNNLGIRFALEKFADYVFLLNNDASIDRNTISELITAAQKDDPSGIYSPIIYKGDKKTIWFCGGNINWWKMKAYHVPFCPNDTFSYETQYSTGCAMLISKNVHQRIGLFDERYFLYYEDADLSVRAKRAGFPVKMIGSANAYHSEQSNVRNARKLYWLVLSGIIFFRKNSPLWMKPWTFLYLLARRCKNRLHRAKNPSNQEMKLVYEAYSDAYKFKPATLDTYSQLQKR